MAKGNGYMMAMAGLNPPARSIPCPFCGKPMSFEDVAWFCRSGERRGSGSNSPCYEFPDSARELFHQLPRGNWAYNDGYQFFCDPGNGTPATHAILLNSDGVAIAEAFFIRGAYGVTNFTVQTVRGYLPADIEAAFAAGAEWVYAPWFEFEKE